jgi:hypothetical protein
MTRKFTVRGHKVRTQSHFRFQIVRVTPEKATIVGRSDSFASAKERASKMFRSPERDVVVVDATTGAEV